MRAAALRKRDSYIVSHQSFVARLASRIMRQYGLPEYMQEDLEAAGYIGLVEAAGRYQSKKNNKFSSYAFYRVRGAMIDEVRRMGSSTVSFKRAYKTIKTANEVFMEKTLNATTEDTDAQLADILDAIGTVLIAHQLSGNEQIDSIVDEQLQQKLESRIEREFLESLILKLPLRQQQVIRSYYFMDMNYSEISKRYKITSKSWVSKLHLTALKNIKRLYAESKNQ